ncbi:Coat F domain-containing protein [Gracilibacillus ureilyticus]|uniref:Coat F domain-containing protein n=1 Tax=Gracilibacillus ureilyticus TaxID=531814 RepID=A0A1H9S229_9BACI|nr:spore coat protein [Gracilibacillus ureilyticus]SER78994.1 Coat F domain-containing protein [Gracilibacillus ureilyticus]
MESNNKIQNPETTVQKTQAMNDRDFLTDILATEKYLTQAYSTALNEASNQHLYQYILNIFEETQNCHRELYNLMFQNGWYSLEQADMQKCQQSYQQFQQDKQQLPLH